MRIRSWLLQFHSLKHYVIAATFVLLLGIILGYSDSGSFHQLIQSQMEHLKGMADKIKQSDHHQWSLFYHIFLNNMLASIMAILLGFFFGIFPLFVLVSNGLLLGYVAADRSGGHTILFFLKGIVPHGIIEIPTFILACALGLRLGFLMLEGIVSVFSPKRAVQFQTNFRAYLKQLLPMMIIITALMLLAAIIESTFTYSIMK
jgi:stage II sporulation protein M